VGIIMTVVTLNDPANPRPSRPASVRAVVAVIWLGLAISAGLASVSLARGGFGDAVHRIQRDHPTPSHQQIVLITAVTLGVLWGLGLVDALAAWYLLRRRRWAWVVLLIGDFPGFLSLAGAISGPHHAYAALGVFPVLTLVLLLQRDTRDYVRKVN